jgi:hypothetical protein
MTHKLDADDFFIHRVQEHCAALGLNFFLIEPLWSSRFYELFQAGKIWAKVLLNMHSEHHDPADLYHRLVRLAHERHTRVIDPPEVALAAFDKARLHPRLVEAGIPVPRTVIVPGERVATFQLSEAERQCLGRPFVIKPSLGYGRRGVILNALTEADLTLSAAAWPGGQYLLQQRIQARLWHGEPAYFRIFYAFGTRWCTWWNCFTDRYRMVNAEDHAACGLPQAEALTNRIAALTGMTFFSTEFAQVDDGGFVAIDYVNDQCHMLSQTANPQIGVPDALVAQVARRLVDAARDLAAKN